MNRRQIKSEIERRLSGLLDHSDAYDLLTQQYYTEGLAHIPVDFEELECIDVDLSILLLKYPDLVIRTLRGLLRQYKPSDEEERDIVLRPYNLPRDAEIRVGDVRVVNICTLVKIRGRIKKIQKVRSKIKVSAWRCKRCGNRICLEVDGTELKSPVFCDPKQGGCGKSQGKTSFVLVEDECTFEDSQVLYIEEPFDANTKGQPQTIMAVVTGDAVGIFTTNEIILNGVLRNYRPKRDVAVNDFYIDVVSVETTAQEEELVLTAEDKKRYEEQVRDLDDPIGAYTRSFAPHIAGCREEKEACILQLFGGVPKNIGGGVAIIRGDIHILFPGDYSSGKSQLLHYSAALAPRGLYTSAENASIVGLTCAVVKDPLDGQWNAEMGVMPLCDGGHAVIDELDKMGKEVDLRRLHTPLEDQIAPYNKAGLVGYFHTRCSVLAGANPKKTRFDQYSSLLEQIPFSGSLLSRFDIIFPMRDIPEKNRDQLIASAVLGVHLGETVEDPDISPRDLRRIIAYARETYNPRLTDEARKKLHEYYLRLREMGERSGEVPIVARHLNGFVRLSEASARARFSNEVTEADVDRAVRISSIALKRLLGSDQFDADAITSGLLHSTRQRRENLIIYLRGGDRADSDIESWYKGQGWTREQAADDLRQYSKTGDVFKLRGFYKVTGGP